MKKGLFVGSFNPVTLAHETIASDLLNNNLLDFIYFIPVNSSKIDLLSIEKRINMINLIINPKENILNIYNYSKNGLFNYNILTKINKEVSITHIIMGSDLFLKFNTFKNYKLILKKYHIIVINRNFNIKEYIDRNYQDYNDKIIYIEKEYNGSSMLAKNNLNNKNNIYLNEKVLDYIKRNNLYI